MRVTRRTFVGVCLAAGGSLVLSSCAARKEPMPTGTARFATGNSGGGYATYGSTLSGLLGEVTGAKLTTVETAGSVENLRMLTARTADLGLSLADSAHDAWQGVGSFSSGALRFTALARIYDNFVQVVVKPSAGLTSFEDLQGKVVSVGPKNSGTAVIADRLLKAAGITVQRRYLDLREAVHGLEADGGKEHVDALIWSGGLPTKPISDLQSTVGVQLIDLSGVGQRLASTPRSGYALSSIPLSTYQTDRPVTTIVVPNYLLARRDLSDAWVWWTLNTMFRRQDDFAAASVEAGSLDIRTAIATTPIPLHPAAERWYRDQHV
ncbi:TAXI family TRAP transporter solute-binding subunit [Kribbella sp. NPDC056861]|uniref:TAXI family TRAP transporter solute-binding subunit n=1 Tax=Kribbella sp. NPDC056861 TaxID=3154857 RepID=UPI0034232C64